MNVDINAVITIALGLISGLLATIAWLLIRYADRIDKTFESHEERLGTVEKEQMVQTAAHQTIINQNNKILQKLAR